MQLLLRIRQADRDIYDDICSGKKVIETRAATSRYGAIALGDTVTFSCGKDRHTKTVGKVYHWPSIEAMAEEVTFEKVMPRCSSLDEVLKVYGSYPGYAEKIRKCGLVGFELV
ncbi:MAG TPA: hypothetical protein VF696_01815 [Candidatus Paceibacterota bacterium]|jgi:ASC-1-like (ASCH) protein